MKNQSVFRRLVKFHSFTAQYEDFSSRNQAKHSNKIEILQPKGLILEHSKA
jgi:hypothetical protein